jgi:urease accessory protein
LNTGTHSSSETRELPSPYLVWQLIDSAFPTGGFAHSGGVEAAVQLGIVRDVDSLKAVLLDLIAQWGSQSAPLVAGAFVAEDPLIELDAWCEALLIGNAPAARASRAQGTALLMAADGLSPQVGELRSELRSTKSPGHLAVILGAVGQRLGLDQATCLQIGAFLALRGALSAAIRLNVIGPLAAQAVQADCAAALAVAVNHGINTPWRNAATSRPALELWQGHHDRLYSRLFQS